MALPPRAPTEEDRPLPLPLPLALGTTGLYGVHTPHEELWMGEIRAPLRQPPERDHLMVPAFREVVGARVNRLHVESGFFGSSRTTLIGPRGIPPAMQRRIAEQSAWDEKLYRALDE